MELVKSTTEEQQENPPKREDVPVLNLDDMSDEKLMQAVLNAGGAAERGEPGGTK